MAQRNKRINLKPGKARQPLTITHPNTVGIDIGSASHYVAVPPDQNDEPVREFPSFTVDLNALADWLKVCGVDMVAMESTGVYWIPLFELLESRGFTVLLVNARHVKNVSGRKSDVLAAMKNVRIRASVDEIAPGNWRTEHLFVLKQALAVISETGADMSRFPTVGPSPVGWDCVRAPRLPAAKC